MTDRNRDDYFSYTKPGELIIMEMQCEKCVNRLANPMTCKEYPERKPSGVLKCQEECPKFKRQ